jgi:hypothetical protein
MDDDDLPPAEEARDRRRDRRGHASEHELMRTGPAKVFKQILDVQARRARETIEEEDPREADEERPSGPRHRHGHGHGHGAGDEGGRDR